MKNENIIKIYKVIDNTKDTEDFNVLNKYIMKCKSMLSLEDYTEIIKYIATKNKCKMFIWFVTEYLTNVSIRQAIDIGRSIVHSYDIQLLVQTKRVAMIEKIAEKLTDKQIFYSDILIEAVRNNNIYIVGEMLQKNIDLNYKNEKNEGLIEILNDYGNQCIDDTLYDYVKFYITNRVIKSDAIVFFVDSGRIGQKIYKPLTAMDNYFETLKATRRCQFVISKYNADNLLSVECSTNELYIFIKEYNWDDGLEVPFYILNHMNCDLGLALNIFYLVEGQVIWNDDFEKKSLDNWKRFVKELYKKIDNDEYSKKGTPFICHLDSDYIYEMKNNGVKDIFFTNI